MLCKDLKVVNLNITEDFYDYKGLFRLCTDEKCLDVDLAELSNGERLDEIKDAFDLEDDLDTIKKQIMEKVFEATKIETKIVEGKDYNRGLKDNIKDKTVDYLNRS